MSLRSRIVILFVILWLPQINPLTAQARVAIPDVSLEVTVRQKEDGEINKGGLHVFKIFCWKGSCSLTVLSLNQCGVVGSGGQGFYPKIETSSTQEGSLEVIGLQDRNGNHTLRVSQSTSEVQIRLIFGYEEDPSGFLATSVRSFSGGYVKDSTILNRVISVEYVPLMGGFHEIELDCAVLLPGVELPGVDFFP